MIADKPVLHRCVGLMICNNGRVLLAKRSAAKSWFPNCWDMIGGHIEPGETHLQALVREATEELAIELDSANVSVIDTVKLEDQELTVFTATQWDGTPINAAPEEHDFIAWLTIDDIARLELELADPAIYRLAIRALKIRSDRDAPHQGQC